MFKEDDEYMEINTFRKNIFKVLSRVAYVYPSIYRVMISGLATDIIYGLLNSISEVFVERFCCSKLHGSEEEPRSLETRSPLKDFPLIITSLHYEPDIVNLARILDGGGIEVFSKRREKQVIIAGGPACMENPVPYSDVIDAFIIGEAEETLPRIIELWLEYGDSKKRFLEVIASLKYVYVPGLTTGTVVKSYPLNLDTVFYPIRQVENTEVEPIYGRGYKLEVSRGCFFWCSFCIETRIFNPYRERSLSTLKNILDNGLQYSLSGRRVIVFSLVFPVSKTHYELLEFLRNEKFVASLPSLRITPYLEKSLDAIKDLGQRTLTLAPESFSPMVHSIIAKYPGMLDYVKNVIETILKSGFDLKLYLIYGYKGLGSSELNENIAYLKELVKLAKTHGNRISVTLNPLVPKPHTMFQWTGMLNKDTLKNLLKVYKDELKKLIDARVYDIDWAIIQAQFALSPKPLGNLVFKWARYGGGLKGWRRAVRELELNYSYVFTGYNEHSDLPWDFIDLGVNVNKVLFSQFETYKKLLRTFN
ncbi:MAG: radical SAM protein [Desulfurococcaceae archaeon]